MTNITQEHLEAAIIDQMVAGSFTGQTYAYVPVLAESKSRCWQLGLAFRDERGYHPIDGKLFRTRSEAEDWADGLNKHIGLHPVDVHYIVNSSMSFMAGAR